MIPNRLHFCWGFAADLDGKPFSLVHYLAVRSAVEVNRPEAATIWCKHPPSGPWWERARPLVDLAPIEPPREIHGVPVRHHAHQTDLVRLELLHRHGGIYLDLDVLCLRPLAPLRVHPAVLGQEGENGCFGLCNAVVLAEPGAFFLERWLEGFDPARSLWRGFRSQGGDAHWGEMAVRYPAMLADRYPEHVHVVGPRAFFWPTWSDRDLRLLFRRDGAAFDESFTVHLWEQRAWDRYLAALTPQEIWTADTNFNRLARRFLEPPAELCKGGRG